MYASITFAVAVETEDQRDVDAATLGDHLLDRGEPFLGAGDLDHQVAAVDPFVQAACCGLGAWAVVGEAGVDLDADVAVDAVGVVVDLGEHVAGAVDVADHHRPVGIVDRRADGAEFGELLVVVVESWIAFWKIDGFEVRPRTPPSRISTSWPEVM